MKKICIIGIGGATTHLINELIKSQDLKYLSKSMIKYGYISANIEDIHQIQDYGLQILSNMEYFTNKDIFLPIIDRKITRAIEYMAIGKKTSNGLGCYGKIENGKKVLEESKEEIEIFVKKLTLNADLVITITAIGGGCGTIITPFINNYVKTLKIPITCFVQKPLKWEGKLRNDLFNKYIDKFKQSANNIIILESKNLVNNTSVFDDFKQMDKSMKNKVIEYLKK